MKSRIAVAVVVASIFASPVNAFAEEKTDDSAKTAAAAGDAAKPQAADADAMWKQIEELKPPELDAKKQKDRAYVQEYFKQTMETAKKRGELAKQFIEKYPDHAKKPEALYLRAEALAQVRDVRSGEFVKTVNAFVEAAPEDERGAMLLYQVGRMERDEAKQEKILRGIVEKYPSSQAARMVQGALRQTDGIGKPVELSFKDAISGKEISMKDLKGKVVVLDFWATWCGPCVAEMPAMKKLYAEYKDKGVEFIGVSLDQPEDQGGLTKLKEFVAKNDITWPQYYQGKGWQSEFSQGWGITGIPTIFIVDADGKLHSTKARGQLEKMIPELLKKAGKEVSLR